MKNKGKITEVTRGKGVYVMEVKRDSYTIKGHNSSERLQNAIREFLKPMAAEKERSHSVK